MSVLSDERMAGRQHFGFKLSTDANGEWVLGGDANGSLSFELAQFGLDLVQFLFPSFCTSMPRSSSTGSPFGSREHLDVVNIWMWRYGRGHLDVALRPGPLPHGVYGGG